ncbi:MAG: HhoA/HhoB/HtrA family serine endopeptidase [Cyanobacteria bacterium P01_A01_bin.3]
MGLMRSLVALALSILIAGSSVMLPAAARTHLTLAQSQATGEPLFANLDASANESAIADNFVVRAVKRVEPAVVRIDTERTEIRQVRSRFSPFSREPFFRDFLGEDFFSQMPQEEEYHTRGQGSGFIVDASGIVVTNAHVVDRADTVSVHLTDGRTFEGEVRGIDEVQDLAIVKINGSDLPVAPVGDSDAVKVGDWAIALGNPLGLDSTVTLGIVSTLDRSSAEVGISDKRLDFIQTDAAINPGNSGGPLLNKNGEVIGINTAIRANAQGIGFAIPIATEQAIQARLVRGETIEHPYIGVNLVTLTPDVRERFNSNPNGLFVERDSGVLVVQVVPDSPAAEAGLRAGDVIVKIGRQEIASASDVQAAVESTDVGRNLRVEVERNGNVRSVQVRTTNLVAST